MIYIDRLIVSLDLRWGGCQWAGVIGVCGALGMPEIVGLLDREFGRDIWDVINCACEFMVADARGFQVGSRLMTRKWWQNGTPATTKVAFASRVTTSIITVSLTRLIKDLDPKYGMIEIYTIVHSIISSIVMHNPLFCQRCQCYPLDSLLNPWLLLDAFNTVSSSVYHNLYLKLNVKR